jgi:RNA polymerase sigma factor (sigma-70 family)
MAPVGVVSSSTSAHRESSAALVAACLAGDADAWSTLIDRYKRLIYSIPIKQGFAPDDAADIFQAVCVDLIAELPRLRAPEALPQWLIRVTYHKCLRHRRRTRQYSEPIRDDIAASPNDLPDAVMQAVQREQALRQAVDALPPRCRRMIEMLFFETPARPYAYVAARLGIAVGSIGFIRGRCLGRLRNALIKAGL